MKLMVLTIAASLMLTGVAVAQSVNECDWISNAANLVEPWDENTRTFSNGKTRLALLDTVEPAAGAFHIVVLSPPYNEVGRRQCRIVSSSSGIGFSGIAFDGLDANYDPSIGLMFNIPVQQYDPSTGGGTDAMLYIQLNQATGAIESAVYKAGE